MELLTALFDFVLHLDAHLEELIAQYGVWTHLILFAIIFIETGIVVMPFLPGDSLLFMAGMGSMSYGRFLTYNVLGGILWVLIFLLGGYYFGTLPIVEGNFSLVLAAVIFLSLTPVLLEFMRKRVGRFRLARHDSVGVP